MASTPSSIAIFPFQTDNEDNCLGRALTVNDTLLSAIKAWIVTKKGSRLGNMVGCFLPDLINELVGIKDMDGLAKRLKQDATEQFPGVNFIDVYMDLDLTHKFVDVIVRITFSTPYTEIQQLELLLPSKTPVTAVK